MFFRLIPFWISAAAAASPTQDAVRDSAGAPETSWAISYGPSDQVQLFLSWNGIGLYTQPIIDYDSYSDESVVNSNQETGARFGAFRAFTALSYRQLECRLLAGAGGQYAERENSFESAFRRDYLKSKQYAAELWMQPEFRFFSRFAVILQAQTLRYVWEQGEYDGESNRVNFDTPDLSLSGLRVGFRYYRQFGSK